MSARRRSALALQPALLLLVAAAARADNVQVGFDLFRTDPPSTYLDFSGSPLPAGFFDPGSDPFTATVHLGGVPLGLYPGCPADNLGQVDTIVQRSASANLPSIPSTDTVPIEIVALHLVSVSPITVTYNGGLSPEAWTLDVRLSQVVAQTQGSMTITHATAQGGTFDSMLPVIPRFVFTRTADNAVRILDFGSSGGSIQFQSHAVPWDHNTPPMGSCTSNFCVNPNLLTVEQSQFAAHGVVAICPQVPVPARTWTWGSLKIDYR